MLPAPYVAGLTQLQDAVPPFSGAQGRAIIEAELGIDLERTFSTISLEPVASASIGQVYRATLRDGGQEVAIKVQRPNILDEIALDLYLLRLLTPLQTCAPSRRTHRHQRPPATSTATATATATATPTATPFTSTPISHDA